MAFHTPIQWGAHSPDALEMFMAMVLFQGRGDSWHRFPSSGDGGVDVVEPLDDGRFRIFQIKGFTGRLSVSGRKTQIQDSLKRASDDPRLPGDVAEWVLVLPIDFTSGEETWFTALASKAHFACRWLGATFWHAETSKYPYVADYYLFDQRERVQRNVQSLIEVMQTDVSAGLGPADVVARLRSLHEAVDGSSPHYRFDFRVTAQMPDRVATPGLVLSATKGPTTGPFVTIDVIARFPQAVDVEPITGIFNIAVPDGVDDPDFVVALQDHVAYGSELQIPDGYLTFDLNAPAGLAEAGVGGGWIGPPDGPMNETILRCRIDSVHGSSELPMRLVGRSAGHGGGFELRLVDTEDLLALTLRIAPAAETVQVGFAVTGSRLMERPVSRLLPGVEFLAALSEAERLTILPELVEQTVAVMQVTEQLVLIDAPTVEAVRLLARLQFYADKELRLPSSIDADTMSTLHLVDDLMRDGEIWGEWDSLDITLTVDRDDVIARFAHPQQAILTRRMNATLGEVEVDFGQYHLLCFSSVLAEEQPESPDRMRLVPAGDRRNVARPGGPSVKAGVI